MISRTVTLDQEGRLELAFADRQQLGLGPGDHVEFFLADDHLVLRKTGRAASVVREDHSTLPAAAGTYSPPGGVFSPESPA